MSDVVVVIGAGLIGQAIARRIGSGKHVVLADLQRENADAAAEVFSNAALFTDGRPPADLVPDGRLRVSALRMRS